MIENIKHLAIYGLAKKIYAQSKESYEKVIQQYYGKYYGKEINKLLDDVEYQKRLNELRSKKKNSEKNTYFIIRRSRKGIGLYTYVCVIISYIAYALEKGYIPVVDMQNYPNIYMTDDKIGKINAWELFYEQPMGLSLNDIPKGSKIIKSSGIYLPDKTPFITTLYTKPKEWRLWSKIYRDFIHFNKRTKDYTEKEVELINNKKVLGVLFRGTDYSQFKPKGHPIQPSLEEAIAKAKVFINKYNCDHIYLATETSEAEKKFKMEFPNMVITNKREYYDTKGIDFSHHLLAEVHFNRKDDNYLRGIEYLSSINILSKCNYFIGGGCAGTYAAIIMNDNKYADWFVWNIGLYS